MQGVKSTDKGLVKMNELFARLKKSEYDASRVLKLENVYGSWVWNMPSNMDSF